MKLMTTQGSQDFIMINSPRFFSRDGEDYVNLFNALKSGKLALAWYIIRNPTNGLIIKKAQVQIDDVLTTTFYTPVPLKLAEQSMRMKATPCEANKSLASAIDHSHLNFLRESLLASLKKGEACFDIFVEPNNEPEKNLIENPTLIWNEQASPFVQVARLNIFQQDDFTSPERISFCENLSFNPWHTDPQLRPMGQINRVRKIVYDGISKYRHDGNKVPEIEPQNHDACSGATAALCRSKDSL